MKKIIFLFAIMFIAATALNFYSFKQGWQISFYVTLFLASMSFVAFTGLLSGELKEGIWKKILILPYKFFGLFISMGSFRYRTYVNKCK